MLVFRKEGEEIMKGVLILALIFNVVAAGAVSDTGTKEELQTVENLIENLASEVIQILNNEELTKEDKLSQLEAVISPSFDFPFMARLSLGRKWKNMTDEEREEYISLFQQRIMHQYVARLLDLQMTGWHIGTIDVSKTKTGEGTKYVVNVDMAIDPGTGPNLVIQWKLIGADIQSLQCVDVSIDGVPLLRNLQQDLRRLLRREGNNIANFLRHMADELQKNL